MNEIKSSLNGKPMASIIVFYGPESKLNNDQAKNCVAQIARCGYKVDYYEFPKIIGEYQTAEAIKSVITKQCEYIESALLPKNDFVVTTGYMGDVLAEMAKRKFDALDIENIGQCLYPRNIFTEILSIFIDFNECKHEDILHPVKVEERRSHYFDFKIAASFTRDWEVIDGNQNPVSISDKVGRFFLDHIRGTDVLVSK